MTTRALLAEATCKPRWTSLIGNLFSSTLLLFVFLILPCAVQAQWKFITTNGAITITGYTGPGGEVTVPSTMNGLPVTSIGGYAFDAFLGNTEPASLIVSDGITSIEDFAFAFCGTLTNITIGNGVTNIGNDVFHYCGNLSAIKVGTLNNLYASVEGVLFNKSQTTLIRCPARKPGTYVIPGSVTNIGKSAFYGCGGLTNITVPNNVSYIGDSAFRECFGLTNIVIPNRVTSLSDSVFRDCSSLTKVIIPNGVANIGAGAFATCSSLINVTIPNTITNISESAFNGCGNLANVTIPNGVINIGGAAFYRCGSLSSIAIPDSVASIGPRAFWRGIGLTNVTIGNNVTSLEEQAFYSCSSLRNLTIGNSVTNIASDALGACYGLSTITVGALNSFYSSVDGVLFDKNRTTLLQYPAGRSGDYTIPNTVTHIGELAFSSSTNLANVTIPDSVLSIGEGAFSGSSVTNIRIPKNVTSIPGNAFYSCSSLTNVVIPEGVNHIGDSAFWHCSALTSVTIPNSVTNIESRAFQVCSGLTRVTIGSGVASIGGWAFFNLPNLEAAYFLGNAPTVGTSVFDYDDKLTVYYLAGTTGWGPTFAGHPTAPWNPPAQLGSSNCGVKNNQFVFTITGTSNLVIVVEACTNLGAPAWIPVSTNSLFGGSAAFSDPRWTNSPHRFYRLRLQSSSVTLPSFR